MDQIYITKLGNPWRYRAPCFGEHLRIKQIGNHLLLCLCKRNIYGHLKMFNCGKNKADIKIKETNRGGSQALEA